MFDYQKFGRDFIEIWYGKIDKKAPIDEILSLTVGKGIRVDFPNNPMDLEGFCAWYEGQCRDYTGQHIMHSVKTTMKDGEMEIYSEITWKAVNRNGKEIEMFPNVTLRLRDEDRFKVFYYGCIDRDETQNKSL